MLRICRHEVALQAAEIGSACSPLAAQASSDFGLFTAESQEATAIEPNEMQMR